MYAACYILISTSNFGFKIRLYIYRYTLQIAEETIEKLKQFDYFYEDIEAG